MASLQDPYSLFLTPEINDEFTSELEGNFEGIGAEIGIKNDILTVISPLPDSPAEKAGLRPGDKIIAIDDLETTGISLNKAVSLIRGEKGSEVTLRVIHKEEINHQEIKIIRDQIHFDSVRNKNNNQELQNQIDQENIAYLQITHFNKDTDQLFEQFVQELVNEGKNKIILDLRSNPGGYLASAIKIASYWVENDVIVKEKTRNEKIQNYSSNGRALLKGKETVILVNGGSASASEIVAGALQDHNLATIVGETTFGKGSVQDLIELSDGSSVKLTIAKWLTPHDRSIDENGIEADIMIELTTEEYNQDQDPQLLEAIRILKNK